MKKHTLVKLIIFALLLLFSTGQLGGCLSCITGTGSISGTVTDATTGLGLSGVTVSAGGVQTITGSTGTYKLENVPAGLQNVTASKSGYISVSQPVLVIADQEIQDVNFSLSPILPSGQIRIVLTWGANPSDLDSHLLVPKSDSDPSQGYHIYYANRGINSSTQYPYAYLDVDDTTSYGPETVTILRRITQKYKYYVYHYAGSGSLATSGAVVRVYSGSTLLKTYNVPTSQTSGYRYWYVFDLNGDGTITDKNIIQSSAPTLP